jgi:hypothetical protein
LGNTVLNGFVCNWPTSPASRVDDWVQGKKK